MNTHTSEKDLLLKRDIIHELKNQTNLRNCFSGIKVRVRDGEVTLIGTTNSYTSKLLIRKTVAQMPGVVKVHDDIQVIYPQKRREVDIDWRSGKIAVMYEDHSLLLTEN